MQTQTLELRSVGIRDLTTSELATIDGGNIGSDVGYVAGRVFGWAGAFVEGLVVGFTKGLLSLD